MIDKKGKVISNTFKLDKYTKIMQEIATTDIHDFDGEQVVNFDDNDETNFLVLSEETVKAECSEEENTLASADYDSSTFVFENINESIRYLQNGDLLYIQPDDENIIAVAVDDNPKAAWDSAFHSLRALQVQDIFWQLPHVQT